jgi:hypothetical protein
VKPILVFLWTAMAVRMTDWEAYKLELRTATPAFEQPTLEQPSMKRFVVPEEVERAMMLEGLRMQPRKTIWR